MQHFRILIVTKTSFSDRGRWPPETCAVDTCEDLSASTLAPTWLREREPERDGGSVEKVLALLFRTRLSRADPEHR